MFFLLKRTPAPTLYAISMVISKSQKNEIKPGLGLLNSDNYDIYRKNKYILNRVEQQHLKSVKVKREKTYGTNNIQQAWGSNSGQFSQIKFRSRKAVRLPSVDSWNELSMYLDGRLLPSHISG